MASIALSHNNITRQFFKFSIPSILGMLIVSMQIMIDGIFLSKGVGPLGLAAVNLAMPLINFILSICLMIVAGGIVLTGIAKGENRNDDARGYTTMTFVLLIVTLTVISLAFLVDFNAVCRLLGANDELMPYITPYLRTILIASVFFCIPNFTEAFTRLNGRPNFVLISGCICLSVNVLLDYLFIMKFGWGMRGAAIATCIANSTAAITLFPFVKMGKIKGTWNDIKNIYFNGSSEMITSVSASVSMYAFNIILMKYIGAMGVAALTIVFYINMIVTMSLFGLSQALYPLVSYNLGAKNLNNIKKLLNVAMAFGASIGIGVYLIVLFTKGHIIRIFTGSNEDLFQLAFVATTYVTIHYLFSFYNIIAGTFHTAVERPVESAVIALCRSAVFTVALLLILPPLIGSIGIWLSMPLAEVLCLFVSFAFMQKSMKRLKVRCAR
ncbi:MAG: MATE family efflux transporter [Bacteroidales bacterium]|nr:MATE family efflux transporter [Bacteroidales bacterium]